MDLMRTDNKIFWGTVVYPGTWKFFGEFIESLAAQTDKSFELLIINEEISTDWIEDELEGKDLKYEIIASKTTNSALKNRLQLIEEAKNRDASLLIIGDCDDTFSPNRAELVIDAFNKYSNASFFYNEIVGMDDGRLMPDLPAHIQSFKDISEYNFLGMSNTAVNMALIDNAFIESLWECDSPIFDWYFHTRLLLNIGYGKLVSGVKTYYRLHDENVAGIRQFSKENLLYERQVKKKHYEMLSQYDMLFRELLKKYENFDADSYTLDDKKSHFWWDLINLEGLQ